ncbi:MAG: sugar transferase [Bacteroidales bacterium]|nr:sugar transferase [Bacteroidales bacterium]
MGFCFKWCFDRVVALVGLVVLFLPLLVIAILIKIDSKGPVFFLQWRIGKDGKPFRICKFRTMYDQAEGDTITAANDPRVTRMGHWLRHSKVDCLTELINVLMGQMSLVGPRPDVPGYADQLQGSDRRILQLRPGITGPASIKYRNEEELLAQQANPKWYNDNVIWPYKVKINLNYLENWTFWGDIQLIFKTVFH